jgi:hypothetical protein
VRRHAVQSLTGGPAAWAVAVGALVLALAGCRGPSPPEEPTPAQAALRLFDLATVDEPTGEQLSSCFESVPQESERAALLDALAALTSAAAPRVERIEALDGLGLAVVDVTAELPGAGTARYSVQVAVGADGSWKVRWFGGPGTEWPRRRRPRGEGLTTSPPPQPG